MNDSNVKSYPEGKIQEWLDELRPFLYKLMDSWNVRRLYDETRDSYLKQAQEHVKDLMIEMISESEEKTKNLVDEITQLMETLSKLSKELDKKVDLSSYEEIPLDLVKEKLNEQVQKYKKFKDELLHRFKQLRFREFEICKKTGAKPMYFEKKLLNEKDLEQFSNYIIIQENEKNRLEKEFMEIRENIINKMNNLHLTDDDDFHKMVQNEPENFIYTKENMQRLLNWEKQLQNRLEQIEKRVKEKKDELKLLWKSLEEPLNYCQEFLQKYSANNLTTYRAFEAEIERCKEKRKQNMAKYIEKLREEIVRLWDLCKFGEEQRKSFVPMHCKNYSESLLTLHELEVDRLRKYYEENKKIFDLVNEFEAIIEQMKILDRRAMDPDRLHNRGGQLLAEEKERKIANRKLPKIQAQILESLEDYEHKNDDVFTLCGLSVNDYFANIWDKYNKEKENIKCEFKKQAKDRSMKKTPLSSSKLTPRMISMRQIEPSKSVKRKLLDESTGSSRTAKGQAANGDSSKKKRTPNYVIKHGKFGSRKSLNSSKSRKNVSKKQTDESMEMESFSSSYEQFQEHLQKREDLRSSCLPQPQHLVISSVKKMKTPVKTPAKPLRRVLREPNSSTKSSKLLCPTDVSAKSPRILRSTNVSSRTTTPSSKSPKTKIQLTVAPGNMPLFL